MALTKVASKYAPSSVYLPKLAAGILEPAQIWNQVADMTPGQFAAYESALTNVDYYSLNPVDQQNYTVAIQAVNQRRVQEMQSPGFNVTIRDGNRAAIGSNLPSLPFGLQWTPLLALGGVLVLLLIMGRR